MLHLCSFYWAASPICRPYYNLNLQSISLNGQPLSIDPSVFATFSDQGTIVDTGTTLAYLVEEAYHTLINAVSFGIKQCCLRMLKTLLG